MVLLLRATTRHLILHLYWSTLFKTTVGQWIIVLLQVLHQRRMMSSVSLVENKVNHLTWWLCFKTKPIKCVWIMANFNWIIVVDLELSELRESVSAWHHTSPAGTANRRLGVPNQSNCWFCYSGTAFPLCWSSSCVLPTISVLESLLSAPLIISSLLPTGCVANFGVSPVTAYPSVIHV